MNHEILNKIIIMTLCNCVIVPNGERTTV